MNEVYSVLIQMLPPVPVIIIGILIIRNDVTSVKGEIKDMKANCEKRLKWCIDHFEPKQ